MKAIINDNTIQKLQQGNPTVKQSSPTQKSLVKAFTNENLILNRMKHGWSWSFLVVTQNHKSNVLGKPEPKSTTGKLHSKVVAHHKNMTNTQPNLTTRISNLVYQENMVQTRTTRWPLTKSCHLVDKNQLLYGTRSKLGGWLRNFAQAPKGCEGWVQFFVDYKSFVVHLKFTVVHKIKIFRLLVRVQYEAAGGVVCTTTC